MSAVKMTDKYAYTYALKYVVQWLISVVKYLMKYAVMSVVKMTDKYACTYARAQDFLSGRRKETQEALLQQVPQP
jgi:copper oxidase (laccase) domain-containing protein